ncbi:MAG: alpha/beta hydrolase [Bryobacteraceae bacterium]
MKRILVFTTVLFILVPVGITAFSANALLGMLQLPRTVMTDWPGAQVIQIEAQDHVMLKAAWVESPSFAGSCVLSLHGAGGWRARSHRFLPWLLPAGYSVLAPDLRAQGESGGETITYGLLEQHDTLAWATWLRGHGCTKIYGMGESLGASVLIMAAGIEPDRFTAIVAECPFANLLESAEERGASLFPFPEAIKAPIAKMAVLGGSLYVRATKGLDFDQVSPVESIAKLKMPILLIHGLADTRTPAEHSKELLAANPQHAQLWLVPGAKHVGAFTMAPEEFKARVLGLFAGTR